MRPLFNHSQAAVLCTAVLLLCAVAQAGTTDLADKPLANATTATILPNIMLDLDSSGSMNWDYMPDYVRMRSDRTYEAWCRDTSGGRKAVCEQGDPPYFATAFNKIYYNPAVRYQWPVDADGTRRADGLRNTSYGPPWNVPSDGFNVQAIDVLASEHALPMSVRKPCMTKVLGGSCSVIAASATTDLTSNYPERRWCNGDSSPVCRPAVYDGDYRYPDATFNRLKVEYGAPYYYNVKVEWCDSAGTCQARKTDAFPNVRFSEWQRVDIKDDGSTFPKSAARTDCADTSCSYLEEMRNFATWYAWYRTRAQAAKSAIGHAFADVRGTPKTGAALLADVDDPTFFHARIGLTTIWNTINLPIAEFEGRQKTSFFSKLYDFVPASSTPLRKSLYEVGRMYQGKSTVYTADPIQHSCQRNFAILATDGYWGAEESGLEDQDSDIKKVSRPSYMPSDDENAKKTLADVAYYFYHTDLRPDMENNVPSSGNNVDVDDVARHQHMTTFTMGLGVDGTLAYQPDYKTAKSGDYKSIVQGPKNWPVPKAFEQTTIDDLWHAAVSGRGLYFSAQDPVALEEGMRKALGSIERADGSGAAAATSNLQPTAGDNFIYIANYRTQLWDGELSAHTIDLNNGDISPQATWQASALLRNKINTDGSDSRTIWTSDASHRLVPFKVAADGSGLSDTQQEYFKNSYLSQYEGWMVEQKRGASVTTLVNYLRGHDPKVAVGESTVRLYRERDKILGDFVHSQPVYVKAAPHNFGDDGYADFKSATEARDGVVYAAANDGMLHAFDAVTGAERWAYIPPMVLPNLWRLADANYGDQHRYFLDGPLAVSDADIGGWKTVLIGALGKGGRGYYALDITNPAAPRVLWTFGAANDPNVGYSYGMPFITKLDGTWVALLTSGYNNVPEGGKYSDADGKGRLFILNLATGAVIDTISTGVGEQADPSGLARINIAVEDFATDDSAIAAYGGDLQGNLWRFNLRDKTATPLLQLGSGMPITTAPEIAMIDNKRAVYVGTGRFLGTADLVASGTRQAIIGVRDNGSGTVEFPGTLVKQTLSTAQHLRTNAAKEPVNWGVDGGWYVELPDNGEGVGIDPQLYFGTLLVSSMVPTASACQPGGYSWLYQLDYRSGGFVRPNKAVGVRQASPVVGMTVSKLPNGTPVIHGVTADGRRPQVNKLELPAGGGGDTKRVLWRELGN